MRIALLTRSYPSFDDLYQYPFVHRRVLAYREAGHVVKVFRFGKESGSHDFEGIRCHTVMPGDFVCEIEEFAPDLLAVHGMDERLWPSIAALDGTLPICGWLHGSEIPEFARSKAVCIQERADREAQLALADDRAAFWRSLLAPWPRKLSLVFVSRFSVGLMERDLKEGVLPSPRAVVIHNPIDTRLFTYKPKCAADRFRILSIRPYDSPTYGNDIAVRTVLSLASHSAFEKMRFTFIGDGPLFETTLSPLRNLPNVTIRRTFLHQKDIALMHRDSGIFLVPTRLDTQGVSRDEAMSSGLVPVTNFTSAVPEFVNSDCAGLADAEDVEGLAREIAVMIDNPELFLARSQASAARVRAQSAHDIVIPRELAWMERCANAAP